MFTKILVAIDGSDHASRAGVAAIWLAKQLDAKLFIISVAARPDPQTEEELKQFVQSERPSRSLEDLAIEEAVQGVLSGMERVARAAGLKDVQGVARMGQPARKIVEFAETAGIDLIVMGTRGRGEIEGLILGSVSHRVSSSAKCSCLLVR
jgi:nucleotide-binding universal stress UspA family protein